MADRILIAEDDLYQRAMLVGHLAEMDCTIVECAAASAAIEQLERRAAEGDVPDLAIVSTRLKNEAGIPLFRALILRFQEIPVVLLSDKGSLGEAQLAIREGVYDYLTKPFESLDDVGFRVSRALERARLTRENREFRAHIEYDLEIARTVQERFLPDEFPHPDRIAFGAHYTACTGVGGDLYDALALDDQHIGAYIFDVSGHGASAALLTAILKMSFEAFVEREGSRLCQGESPTLAAIDYLNPLLKRCTTSTQFATMLYTVIDLDRETLAFTSAGHCYPILVEPDGAARYVKPDQGPPVGVLLDASYKQDFLPFPPGSMLILYTDGINEAYSPDGEQWGMSRVLESVSKQVGRDPASVHPQAVIDGLIEDLQDFTKATTYRDDVTALAFRFLG